MHRLLPLLLLPFLLLAACNTHDPSTLAGKDGTSINLGKSINVASQSYTNVGFDKYGHPRMTMRDNSEAVPIHALDTAETVAGGLALASVQKAKDAGDAAVAVSAHKAAVNTAKISADAATAAGAQEVQKTAILHPPQ